ncbi:MAG: protein phosphatase 2C domain-containing protein [Verrucomicrobia bacterium]|jgi:serine/threonine protein phosphatase PrpC|nr:protein phosphatase 2C domain-containing protein [Verrucomicrobiota bacterium]
MSVPVPPFWRAVGASVVGTSHVKTHLPCQDRLRWELLGPQRLMVALADGAGSATYAEVGAETAVTTAANFLRQALPGEPRSRSDDDWRALLREALAAARAAVVVAAKERDVRPRELATTLLLAVCEPDVVAGAQVGDGGFVVGDAAGELTAVTRPGQSEYINETVFLTAEDALERPQLEVRRGAFTRAALFSDGLQMLAMKFPEATPHAPFFRPLLQFVEGTAAVESARRQLEAFLRSPRITERTDDDLTLLLAVRAALTS